MLDRNFPRYEKFDPTVPVWCVTPDFPGCIHRFFDTSPISPSGRYLALFHMPFEDRRPKPGEKGAVRLVDLTTGENTLVAETHGWEQQMGANINWGASDRELFFNDVGTENWRPFAWKFDPLSGEKKKLEGTVYHASPDGRWLVSANMAAMRKTQPGYGIVVPKETVRPNIGPSESDGFYLTDTQTGESKLFASIRELITRANPPVQMENPEKQEIYGFHSKFSPDGKRLMLSLRWFPTGKAGWDMFSEEFRAVRYAWLTTDMRKNSIHCAVGPEQWEKRGHHATWFPDSENISMNLKIDLDEMRFVEVRYDGTELRKMHPALIGSGHPTVHTDGCHILTDTYTYGKISFGDGTVPLRWIDLKRSGRMHRAHKHRYALRRWGFAGRSTSGMGQNRALRYF